MTSYIKSPITLNDETLAELEAVTEWEDEQDKSNPKTKAYRAEVEEALTEN